MENPLFRGYMLFLIRLILFLLFGWSSDLMCRFETDGLGEDLPVLPNDILSINSLNKKVEFKYYKIIVQFKSC